MHSNSKRKHGEAVAGLTSALALALFLLPFGSPASAAPGDPDQAKIDPKTGKVQGGGELTGEPDIEIRYGQNDTRYEYRINGELVQIKVQPKVGPAYYLIPDQDGAMIESDRPNPAYPTWKLFQW